MKLFRTRYQVRKNGKEWLTVLCRRWWWWKWTFVGAARDMEEAMEIIKSHRDPVLYEE